MVQSATEEYRMPRAKDIQHRPIDQQAISTTKSPVNDKKKDRVKREKIKSEIFLYPVKKQIMSSYTSEKYTSQISRQLLATCIFRIQNML